MAEEIKYTDDQIEAIEYKVSDILVSAAAGSGKSTVLVQRILNNIVNKGMSINRMLIATFTNNAAASLKAKINNKILEALEDKNCSPELNRHLTKELSHVSSADISTLDSFFQKLVKTYFFVIDINPNFTIIDSAEAGMILDESIDRIFNEYYKKHDEQFLKFVDCYGDSKSDNNARKIIKEIVNKASSYPFPSDYIKALEGFYNIEDTNIDKHPFLSSIYEKKKAALKEILANLVNSQSIIKDDKTYATISKAVAQDILKLNQFINTNTLSEAMAVYNTTFERNAKMPAAADALIFEEAKQNRAIFKECYKENEEIFSLSPEDLKKEVLFFKDMAPIITRLADEVYTHVINTKKNNSTFEFGDIPKFCVEILSERTKDGLIQPSNYAKEVRDKYDEIMIDEYQDSNKIQEFILELISGRSEGKNNVFMVGDVKQSIYRFRQAEPGIFNEKYLRYIKKDNEDKEKLVPLKENYRSTQFVIDTVNELFKKVMVKELGGVEYKDEYHVLNHGADYKAFEKSDYSKSELLLFSKPADANKDEAAAAIVAQRIKELLDSDFPVYEKNQTRKIQPGDICVLYNSIKGNQPTILNNILNDAGIPCFKNSKTGFYESIEIIQIMNFLKILNNPYQDIELVSILRSYMCGLTDEELAQIVIAKGKAPKGTKADYFYDSMLSYVDHFNAEPKIVDKINLFLDKYDILKSFSYSNSLRDIIQKIYDVTGFVTYCYSQPAGVQKVANLDMLLDIATSFQGESFCSIGSFISYVDNLKNYNEDTGEAFLGESTNAVQIMTYHASKGLEYPVVIVAETHKKPSNSNKNSVMFCSDKNYGDIFTVKYSNPDRNIKRNCFIASYIKTEDKKEELAEKLRVLYVALTRAKQKLIMLGYVSDSSKYADEKNKYLENYKDLISDPANFILAKEKTYLDLIAPVFLSESYPFLDVKEIEFKPNEYKAFYKGSAAEEEEADSENNKEDEAKSSSALYDDSDDRLFNLMSEGTNACDNKTFTSLNELDYSNLLQEIKNYFSYNYPHPICKAPVKYSVSELKHEAMDELEKEHSGTSLIDQLDEEAYEPYTFNFDGKLTPKANRGARRGTMYHLLMEHIIKTDIKDYAGVKAFIEAKIEEGLFTEDILKMVQIKDICAFLSSEIADRMRKADSNGQLYVEQPFVLALKAKEIDEKFDTDDIILLQGEIDAFFIEAGEAVILDYKTDKVSEENGADELISRYKRQIELYELAVNRIKGVNVKSTLLYSFTLGKELYIKQ